LIKINEIFYSIQGEGTSIGLPCVFVRLTYCNLRCTYCDTEYAFFDGKEMSIDEILEEIKKFNCNLVEITGGEPLVQNKCNVLLNELCDYGYKVMIETGGSLPIKDIDNRVKIIMDIKCPSSGMEKKNDLSNIDFIKNDDEIKFVIGDFEDYMWSKNLVEKFKLIEKCIVLFSPVFGKLENQDLAKWILNDNLNVRFQIQLHKYIWDPNMRGV
jgi:7-carboxy-7-deazaguanine synthase